VVTRLQRVRSTAITPPVSAATRGRTKIGRCRVGPPVGPAAVVLGGDRSRKVRNSKGPVVDGTFLVSRVFVSYRKSSATPSPSRTLT
jgi:hypothetical protein